MASDIRWDHLSMLEIVELRRHIRDLNDPSDRKYLIELEEYLKTGKPFDKSGAYGIQEVKDVFVKKFTGSFTSVMGLPVRKTAELLSHFGVQLKPNWEKTVKQKTGYED